ncbi:hypothetical protein Tco_1463628, partial [Tanacetum coccineum]
NTFNFLVDNPRNDADSIGEFVPIQNEEVATLEENVFSEGKLDQNSSSSHGVQNVRRSSRQSVFLRNYNDALLRNGTWEFVELPEGRKAIGSKWIYKIKFKSSASSASALQVLRILGSIFTSVYAAVQKLKKKLEKALGVEVPQTLEYRGGQLNAAHVLEVENFTNWKKRFMCHIIGPSNVKESRVMDLKLCYNIFKFKEGESLTQTFTRYKTLMNELVNDGIKLSKLEINTGFINELPKKWLSFCQSLRNTNHVKDSELASLFGKLKYEDNLIDIIYEIEKSKSFVSATHLSTAFFSTSIVQDFQDSPNDEDDTRSSQEYLNDLEEEYQARAL